MCGEQDSCSPHTLRRRQREGGCATGPAGVRCRPGATSAQASEGWDLTSPEFRALFERENILSSSWYAERLDAKVARDTRLAHQAIEDLTRFYTADNNEEVIERLGIEGRLAEARAWLDKVSSPAYREHLVGTLGLQPSLA